MEYPIPIFYIYNLNNENFDSFKESFNNFMMSKGFFNIFNYSSLGIVIVLVVLMYTQIAPRESFIYIVVFALLLLAARIVLRVYYIKQSKKDTTGG